MPKKKKKSSVFLHWYLGKKPIICKVFPFCSDLCNSRACSCKQETTQVLVFSCLQIWMDKILSSWCLWAYRREYFSDHRLNLESIFWMEERKSKLLIDMKLARFSSKYWNFQYHFYNTFSLRCNIFFKSWKLNSIALH